MERKLNILMDFREAIQSLFKSISY
jgi:hypothetical protein